jgi:hypothetical protein
VPAIQRLSTASTVWGVFVVIRVRWAFIFS